MTRDEMIDAILAARIAAANNGGGLERNLRYVFLVGCNGLLGFSNDELEDMLPKEAVKP